MINLEVVFPWFSHHWRLEQPGHTRAVAAAEGRAEGGQILWMDEVHHGYRWMVETL
jgi:hypothetical protein